MSWIDEERGKNENKTHWKLRKAFLTRYENDYPRERLKCLSFIFCNVTFLSCKYDGSIMKLVEGFSKELEAEVKEATQYIPQKFSLPTLSDSDADSDDEGQPADLFRLTEDLSRMEIPEPETLPSPLPMPYFGPKIRQKAAHSIQSMSFSNMTKKATLKTKIVCVEKQPAKKLPNKDITENSKQGSKFTIVQKSRPVAPKKELENSNKKSSTLIVTQQPSQQEVGEKKKKRKKNRKKFVTPSEEIIGAVEYEEKNIETPSQNKAAYSTKV